MTDEAGRLLDDRGALMTADGSLEYNEVGGVLAEVPGVLRFLIDVNFESLISTISSSASLSKLPFACGDDADLVLVDHLPSGSMVT